ncbi:helix-turn-helix domain-containing protein [Gracilibacillus sp. S3-1-1]|uniref:Helix-turn-helix domain-containing protein n=1 Tax=Gracilibacillus pellucidus TaxID=3095368 RepID=A0ACC6M8C7_9BACI|nr:helix-turn-helix domain-containing protein [Gracilibacillus sp. S3-1-1]MDX8047220.1 helix-turn-helix domain-containing protein [Gracilibacillus sp. S3-1-1]
MKEIWYYQDIHYIARMLYQALRIPVSYIEPNSKAVVSYPQLVVTNPAYSNRQELMQQLSFQDDSTYQPIYKTTPYFEQFISLKIGHTNGAVWLLGPTLPFTLTEGLIHGMITDLEVKVQLSTLSYYYDSLAVIPKARLKEIGLLMTYMITRKKLSREAIVDEVISDDELRLKENPDILVSKSRQEVSFHNTYHWEKVLLQAIRDGDKEKLKELIDNPDGRAGVLSKKSHLRNSKNLAISVITLATRAAIEGGVYGETAYTISDLFIQELEELQQVKEVLIRMNKALFTFTDKVKETRRSKYSPPILKCQTYIYQHLYEKITLQQLAKLVNIHESYLSILFTNEVGIPISKYIVREKIEEAKRLLLHTDSSITDIYTLLQFYDQSHFTKTFKKIVGVTPRTYRQKSGTVD